MDYRTLNLLVIFSVLLLSLVKSQRSVLLDQLSVLDTVVWPMTCKSCCKMEFQPDDRKTNESTWHEKNHLIAEYKDMKCNQPRDECQPIGTHEQKNGHKERDYDSNWYT